MTPRVNHRLFDAIIGEFNLRNDAHLADFLDIPPPHVSRLRRREYDPSGDMILRIYDKTGWSIERIRGHLRGPE